MEFEQALASIKLALNEIGEEHLSPETILFGQGGKLDSLGLVSLIVETEQILSHQYACQLSLADSRAFAMETSPFRSVQSFAEFIVVKAEAHGQ